MSDAVLALQLEGDVRAAARGDHGAFGRLVDATRTTVDSIALAILRDVELARETAQDVYLAVWTDLGKLREPASFLPWLRQVTRNRAHAALRTQVRRRKRISEGHADELMAAAADPRPNAIERLVAEEERAALAAALDALPAPTREAVVLFYREGQSARQVGELLGMSEDAVKQRLSRARIRLRGEMARRLEETAPTAAFTAAVLVALSLASPGAASATAVAAGGAAAAGGKLAIGGKTAVKVGAFALTSAVSGAFVGLFGGWMGVLAGARKMLAAAHDEEERRGIRRFAAVCMLGSLVFIATIVLRPRPVPVTIAFAVMIGIFAFCHFAWLPRIVSRRMEAELRADPEGAAKRHAHARKMGLLGFAAGLFLGSAPIVLMWLREM
jgi:RNA polymerase sigma factor (sigma-70 family)